VLDEVQRAEVLGLNLTFDGIDGDGLAAFRQGVIDTLHKGLHGLVTQRCTLVEGRGVIRGPGTVEVTADDGTTRWWRAVTWSSRPGRCHGRCRASRSTARSSRPPTRRCGSPTPPGRAVIIGAGAIGMEFASMWHPMGTEVTVVEALDRVLPLEDADAPRRARATSGDAGSP
jgi:dihydrolipoamide dehydrogenase